MECLVCGNKNLRFSKSKISTFVSLRVYGLKEFNVKIFQCKNCGFSFYDKRFDDFENAKLYNGYRSQEYQIMRQKSEPWYTEEVNANIGKGAIEIQNRSGLIGKILTQNQIYKAKLALDYGGDMGQFFPKNIDFGVKFVYDISGVEVIDGVIQIRNYEDAKKLKFDFVMCNQVLEHIGDLDDFIRNIKLLGGDNTKFYFEVPYDSPYQGDFISKFKSWIRSNDILLKIINYTRQENKLEPFGIMSEHINYFTPKALKLLLTRNGFNISDLQVNSVDCGWSLEKYISTICTISIDE